MDIIEFSHWSAKFLHTNLPDRMLCPSSSRSNCRCASMLVKGHKNWVWTIIVYSGTCSLSKQIKTSSYVHSKDPSLDGGVGLERGRIFLLLSKSVGLHIQVSGHGTSSRTLPDDGFGEKS